MGLTMTGGYMAMGSFCAIAVERYVAVFYPFQYFNTFTHKTTTVIIIVLWTINTILGALVPAGMNHWTGQTKCTIVDIVSSMFMIIILAPMVTNGYNDVVFCHILLWKNNIYGT